MSAKSDPIQNHAPDHVITWQRQINPRWLELRLEVLQLFKCDESLAKTCTAFIQLHKNKVLAAHPNDHRPIVFKASKKYLRMVCLGTISIRTLDVTLPKLEELGYITIAPPTGMDRRFSYTLNVEKLNRDLMALPNIKSICDLEGDPFNELPDEAIGIDADDIQRLDELYAADLPHVRGNSAARKFSVLSSEVKEEQQHTPLPLITESENEHADEQAEEDSEYLPEAEASEIIYNALKTARGYTLPAKTPKAREKIRESLRFNLMGVAVRADRVEPVVERFVEWCRSKRGDDRPPLPTAICHGDWQRLLSGEESLDVDSAPPPRRPPASEAPPVRRPPASESAPPSNGIEWVGDLPEFAHRWNTVVKSGAPVKIWDTAGWDHKNLIAAAANKGFTEKFDEVLEKCESILAVGNPLSAHLTFGWLIKPGNYAKPINGDVNYAAKPEKSSKPKELSIEERLQRAIAFRPESEYKGK